MKERPSSNAIRWYYEWYDRVRAEAAELLGITEAPPEAKEEQKHDEN
jgi:hypothetical protein